MARIRSDLYCSVIENYVGIWHTVILVHPLGIESEITFKCICIVVYRLSECIVIVPTVEDCIESFGLGELLESYTADKETFLVFKLVCEHVVCYCASFSSDKGIYIECSEAVIPVVSECAEVIRRCEKNFGDIIEGYVHIILHKECYCCGCHRRREGSSVHRSVSAVFK